MKKNDLTHGKIILVRQKHGGPAKLPAKIRFYWLLSLTYSSKCSYNEKWDKTKCMTKKLCANKNKDKLHKSMEQTDQIGVQKYTNTPPKSANKYYDF